MPYIDKYTEYFSFLHTNKQKGMPAPHKAVLLLSVIDMVEVGVIKSNGEDVQKFQMCSN